MNLRVDRRDKPFLLNFMIVGSIVTEIKLFIQTKRANRLLMLTENCW